MGFTFKNFHISQDHTAMKVGTDGVLLGAWAEGGADILDIGTGTDDGAEIPVGTYRCG